jgi:plastocyanin
MKSSRMSRKRLLAIGLTAATLVSVLAVAAPAPATTVNGRVISPPAGALVGFTNRVVFVSKGSKLMHQNLDPLNLHDLDSPSGRFSSKLVGFNKTANVTGVSTLPPGNYPFRCSLHSLMTGTLIVRKV